MSTLTIQVPAGLKSKLTALAKRRGKTTEQFVQETLASTVQGRPSAPNLHALSRDLCGSLDGGPTDLAGNKEHLKGYGSWKR
jgi:hypothetical protein